MVKSIKEVLETYGKVDRWSIGDTVWFAISPNNSKIPGGLRYKLVATGSNINYLYDKLSDELYITIVKIENE